MGHDVFVSHSSLDKLAADAVCHGLEARGIRCWIAPRDQVAGRAYGEQITAAIENAQVMVLVFSDHVNNSQAVLNEINIAVGANVTIVPLRIAKSTSTPSSIFTWVGCTGWTPSRHRSIRISTRWPRRSATT
ncbi:MAG: toll/interleukin-1 receptor domain-containing protein [Caulobacteraceae bacterium]